VRWHGAILAASAAWWVVPHVAGGVVDIGGNWRAEWDESLDGLVDIATVAIFGDTIFIQKSAEFTQPPVNGAFPSIDITFRQVGHSDINHIAIDAEVLTNSTDVEWTDFHFILLDQGDAVFNPELTAASGGGGPIGFSIDPFTQAAFSEGNRRLDVWGGTVAPDALWTPGTSDSNGQLFIDVFSDNKNYDTVFTLKETPTPGAGTLAAMLIGGIAARRRRRD
jgi:MYXO-CTERM domain-containing protein